MIPKLRVLPWIFFFFFSACSYGAASEEDRSEEEIVREDLPFFRIIHSGREIYFLGVVHGIPLNQLLSGGAIEEIHRLHAMNATLFLEHPVTNEHYLPLLRSAEYLSESDDRSRFFNEHEMYTELGYLRAHSGKFFLNQDVESDVDVSEVEKIKASASWFVSLPLQTHNYFLLRQRLGVEDTEDALSRMFGHERTHYLETHENLIDIYGRNSVVEEEFNVDLAKYMIFRLKELETLSPEALRHTVSLENKDFLQSYSWDIIRDRPALDASLIERNHLWSRRIADKIRSESGSQPPLLIVAGNLHFAGTAEQSFISLLSGEFQLERFTADGWRRVEDD